MSNDQTRYDGKPLLRLLELWVQWAIGEIDPQALTRLSSMEPNLRKTWKLEGAWHEMIESLLELKPSIRDDLRSIWQRNLATSKQQGVDPPLEMFSQSIADQLIG